MVKEEVSTNSFEAVARNKYRRRFREVRGHLHFICNRKMRFMYVNDTYANVDNENATTNVKHITIFVKITIFA